MGMEELLIDAELEIEILGFTEAGVNLKIKLRRDREKGFREDALKAMFNGVILKAEEYSSLPVGTIIVYDGIKVPVKVECGVVQR